MNSEVIGGILIPFVGISYWGSGIFMKKELSDQVQQALTGFAAGGDGGGFGMRIF